MDLHLCRGRNLDVTVVTCKPTDRRYIEPMGERRYYVYIMASRSRNLYVGMTGNIETRARQHQTKHFAGFTADYNCNRLVYYERYADPNRAIAREKQLKGWSRSKKLTLISTRNPTWIDLSESWGQPITLQPAKSFHLTNLAP